jgi:hypothetical protein
MRKRLDPGEPKFAHASLRRWFQASRDHETSEDGTLSVYTLLAFCTLPGFYAIITIFVISWTQHPSPGM